MELTITITGDGAIVEHGGYRARFDTVEQATAFINRYLASFTRKGK